MQKSSFFIQICTQLPKFFVTKFLEKDVIVESLCPISRFFLLTKVSALQVCCTTILTTDRDSICAQRILQGLKFFTFLGNKNLQPRGLKNPGNFSKRNRTLSKLHFDMYVVLQVNMHKEPCGTSHATDFAIWKWPQGMWGPWCSNPLSKHLEGSLHKRRCNIFNRGWVASADRSVVIWITVEEREGNWCI